MYGDLGSGKTTISKGIAKGACVEATVTSPTFILMNQYIGKCKIYHFDIYRLSDPDELYDLGFEEYIYGDGIALVEWPEKMGDLLPQEYLKVTLEKVDNDKYKRTVRISPIGKKYDRYKEALLRYESTCP